MCLGEDGDEVAFPYRKNHDVEGNKGDRRKESIVEGGQDEDDDTETWYTDGMRVRSVLFH